MADSTLRLLADDAEGLDVIAAAVQDAIVRPQDIRLDSRARTFGLEMNRFQWESAGPRPPWFRARAVLAFGGVELARSRNLPKGIDDLLALLNVEFHPAGEPPAGEVRLQFAPQGEVRLAVECLDVTLMDTGVVWPTRRRPDHHLGDEAAE